MSNWLKERHDNMERERILRQQFIHDPATIAPTACRVLKPLCIRGERVEPGGVVTLQRSDAETLQSVGRVEIVK
jgi:hypothetical protein